VDTRALKESFAKVAQRGDQVPLFFYSYLFLAYPQTREMFPASMARQRDRLFAALGQIASDVDNLDSLALFLQQLGRDHRKFGVVADHYPAVGEALLATLEHFLGEEWTPSLAGQWQEAYRLIGRVMDEAAQEAARTSPAWWDAEVVAHERRSLDIAVIQVRPEQPYDYLPGQSVAVECPMRPRMWRYYSPANAPRADGTLEFHIRFVGGGPVSGALLQVLRPGDVLRLGAPVGHRLTLSPEDQSDLLLLAGGTGLTPLRAVVEQVASEGGNRQVHLFVGGRGTNDLYDMATLSRYEQMYPWLTVVPAVSDDPTFQGARGTVVDVALKQRAWDGHRVYVCGSPAMVTGTLDRLAVAGLDKEAVFFEDFGGGGWVQIGGRLT
jgi:NAD(P)H-flavin reductase/hemoglobin-like flavoprotein